MASGKLGTESRGGERTPNRNLTAWVGSVGLLARNPLRTTKVQSLAPLTSRGRKWDVDSQQPSG